MLARILLGSILSILLLNVQTNAFSFDVGKTTCKLLHFTVDFTASEVQEGSYLYMSLFKDDSYGDRLSSLTIDLSQYSYTTMLSFDGDFEFGEKLTKSYPNAVLYVSILDENSDVLQFTDGSTDSAVYSAPIKCVPIGAIIGGVVGGVAVLAIVVTAVIVIRKKRQNKQNKQSGDQVENANLATQPTLPFSPQFGVQTGVMPDGKEPKMTFMPSPPTTYASPQPQPMQFNEPPHQPFMAQGQQPFIYHN